MIVRGVGRGGRITVYVYKSLCSKIVATSEIRDGTSPEYSSVVVTGDFNCDMLSTTSFESKYLSDLIKSYPLQLVSSPATHHAVNRDRVRFHRWLDLYIVHSLNAVINYVKSDVPFTYGHGRIDLTISFARYRTSEYKILDRNLSRLVGNVSFLDDVKRGLNSLPENSELNNMVSYFNTTSTASLDRFAPLHPITITACRKPCVPPAFRAAIKNRDQFSFIPSFPLYHCLCSVNH
ncbi:hypothetical protein TSAR_009700 [Trichomalopsis sarcophagae]|uniref:Endonuclease/exonuclease/phosphatase domain-containing protein n=1 Tax=Trichomalopsis sarcophagae TaxID=543379 RepID=A0A232EZS1_9HYME|nr:hypothetical protein TSAR_009700 [Trichomalopsis sarcophagae]